MLHIRNLIAIAILAAASLIAAAPSFAQGTKVIVLDEARVISESLAGKDIAAKLETIRQQMRQEAPSTESMQQQALTLRQRTANMTPEAIQADEDLLRQAQALEEQSAEARILQLEFQATENQALEVLIGALGQVLQEVQIEQNAQIILERNQVMFADGSVDVSAQVIQKLDSRLPSVQVNRVRFPREQAAAANQ